MDYDIEIEQGSQRVGSVTIVKNPQQLYGLRTASGFEIQVPILLTLRVRPKNEPMLMVNHLRGKVFVKSEHGSLLNVGYLTNEERHIAGITSGEGYDNPSDIRLEWRGSLTDIAYIEKARNGQAPKLQMQLEGDWCFLTQRGRDYKRTMESTNRAAAPAIQRIRIV